MTLKTITTDHHFLNPSKNPEAVHNFCHFSPQMLLLKSSAVAKKRYNFVYMHKGSLNCWIARPYKLFIPIEKEVLEFTI